MAIERGNIDATKLYRGVVALTKVYKGSTLIWEPPVSNTINNFNSTMTFNMLKPTETKFASTMMLYLY